MCSKKINTFWRECSFNFFETVFAVLEATWVLKQYICDENRILSTHPLTKQTAIAISSDIIDWKWIHRYIPRLPLSQSWNSCWTAVPVGGEKNIQAYTSKGKKKVKKPCVTRYRRPLVESEVCRTKTPGSCAGVEFAGSVKVVHCSSYTMDSVEMPDELKLELNQTFSHCSAKE